MTPREFTDAELLAELKRRQRAAGKSLGGRPKIMLPCRICKTLATAAQRAGMDGGPPCGHKFPRGKPKKPRTNLS
jgi:hypothetical protein